MTIPAPPGGLACRTRELIHPADRVRVSIETLGVLGKTFSEQVNRGTAPLINLRSHPLDRMFAKFALDP